MNSPKCGQCGAPVRWHRLLTGGRVALDAEPTPDGPVSLSHSGVAFWSSRSAPMPDEERFTVHICPPRETG